MRLKEKKGIPQKPPLPSTSFLNARETEEIPSGDSARNLVKRDEEILLERQKNAKHPARAGKTCSARSSDSTKEYELRLASFEAERRLKKQPRADLFSSPPMIKLELFSIDCLSWFSSRRSACVWVFTCEKSAVSVKAKKKW
jgi:hypothetical protein